MIKNRLPIKQGLYDPQNEHDNCGVGFVCNIDGGKSNDIIKRGLDVLGRLNHRGAVGADPRTGDGAGILIQIPHKFLLKQCRNIGIVLPKYGWYGTGLIFFPTKNKNKQVCIDILKNIINNEGQNFLGLREVPVDVSAIGKGAKDSMPVIFQVFIGRDKNINNQLDFERKLYVIRRQVENKVKQSIKEQNDFFYINNLSSRTLSYKGLLMPCQVKDFFLDLQDELIESSLCLVHSRYSTNTFPTWDLAQPFRFLAHNGEINTLRGNINWTKAREQLLASDCFGADIEKLKPIILERGSDSAAIDNIFELLVLSGKSLCHSMMMLIPSAWEYDKFISRQLKDFYKYHACFMEPWDGPAAIAFTDGQNIGAILDRNGLRPARYIVTKDGFVVMASEVGVLDIDPVDIEFSGRLEPGKIFFIDTEKGKIIQDSDVKENISKQYSYGKWNDENMLELENIKVKCGLNKKNKNIVTDFKAFGYTREDLRLIIKPMAEDGKEPIGSMGNDTPYAFLSKQPQVLFNYFRQLFAQVTNPAIDSIRERIVMSLESFIGPEKNILEVSSGHCRKIRVKNPVLTNEELEKIKNINISGFKSKVIYTFFDEKSGKKGFSKALDRICLQAEKSIGQGYSFIVLSDVGANKKKIALPALLAMSAVHQHLVKKSIRAQASIIIESAEVREVHHFALLFGYGADCINPYLAYNAIEYLIGQKDIKINLKKALKNYNKAVSDGILKILSKMGISTLRSYRGAQIFEALGLDNDFIDKYFTGTVTRIGGVSLEGIIEETLNRHKYAYPKIGIGNQGLPSGGIYQWKKDGEFHLWNPDTIAILQDSARNNDYEQYKEFAQKINNQKNNPTTLRSLLKFKKTKAISISEVEPVENIMKRFATGAMSFGSISRFAHETIAIAMNRISGKSNTGEGGEDPNRFVILPNGDSKRSAIKQVASGRFGVTINYLVNADEIQIKIAQGAKPGEGGQLPGYKVNKIIAQTRYTTAGVTLISPPPHHDIYSIEDLAQLIFDLKNANSKARISVKLVSEVGVGTIAAGVAKGHADMILISGGDGGTGASSRSSIRYAGLPWELGLSETHQTLLLNDLRSKVCLQTDGQMRTGRDVAIAVLLGAEEYGFCTAALIICGCVMLRHCHLNNCSVGVATQDSILQKRFKGKPEHIVNYFYFVAQELREIMACLGMKTINEMIGKTEFLELNKDIIPSKAKGLDFSGILYKPKVSENVGKFYKKRKDNSLDSVIDKKLISMCKDVFTKNESVNINLNINNTNRTTGAMLSGEVCRKCGDNVLLKDTITCNFKGIAGQSFGAFLASGITFKLEGMANDYVGKGISGGRIIVYPDKKTRYIASENIIIGNTCFYGAISGAVYINGSAGERFCIRNSGLYAVVEGVGDHACEYMTGGRVIVLGKIGRNFAAGMSGGIAYVYDKDKTFKDKCNTDMVALEDINENDKEILYVLINNHFKYTESVKAKHILDNTQKEFKNFVKIIPFEYKRILEAGAAMEKNMDLMEESDG
jgi:glutamate synthase (NADPH) large chain